MKEDALRGHDLLTLWALLILIYLALSHGLSRPPRGFEQGLTWELPSTLKYIEVLSYMFIEFRVGFPYSKRISERASDLPCEYLF